MYREYPKEQEIRDKMNRDNGDYYYTNMGEFGADMSEYIRWHIPNAPEKAIDAIFAKAWSDGHSAGYNEVWLYIAQYIEFTQAILKAYGVEV